MILVCTSPTPLSQLLKDWDCDRSFGRYYSVAQDGYCRSWWFGCAMTHFFFTFIAGLGHGDCGFGPLRWSGPGAGQEHLVRKRLQRKQDDPFGWNQRGHSSCRNSAERPRGPWDMFLKRNEACVLCMRHAPANTHRYLRTYIGAGMVHDSIHQPGGQRNLIKCACPPRKH